MTALGGRSRPGNEPSSPAPGVRWTLVVGAVVLLAASNVVVNTALTSWAYVPWNFAVAGALLLLVRQAGVGLGEIGLDRSTLGRSVRWGAAGALVVSVAYGVALALPATRELFSDLRASDPHVGDLLYHALIQIPLGTVVLEELAFRGVLPAAFGAGDLATWRWRPVLAASTLFGLWHVLPSAQVLGNAGVREVFDGRWLAAFFAVAGTAAAGLVLCWLRWKARGLLAPIMVHVATNSLGFALAWSLAR